MKKRIKLPKPIGKLIRYFVDIRKRREAYYVKFYEEHGKASFDNAIAIPLAFMFLIIFILLSALS